ncbi:OpgC family protein [Swingsia samuiensis]|uniref:OpgC domain-containing protein n=1 Tax=Swingsia samuiensis TaxID=1293412 RepID=A0A4Y6UMR8_9PROT|nr:OpgC domain-containing protein [Swingsia samuiensis]QDH17325.1 OpgC domain-containing protein [Swingsia samuiensis]
MQASTPSLTSNPPKKHLRDHRVDALRGLALLMMLADHVPDDLANRITIRNFSFADAAEIFVMLAGYASFLAYGRLIDRQGWLTGFQRIFSRCLKLYIYQTGLTFIFIWTVRHWRHYQPVPEYILEPQLAHGYDWVWRILTFDALPSYLNILPLYIVLLALFPLIYMVLKKSVWLLLASSIIIWAIANIDPHLTIPNWLDPNGWYLNPFGWQLLYILGILGAVWATSNHGSLPSYRWLKFICWSYLFGAFILCFPYEYWHLGALRLFPVPPSIGKATLAPWRLLDIMSIFYLVQSSQKMKELATTKLGQAFALLGRNSLEVFSFGTVLDLLGRLVFSTFGTGIFLQIILNIVGFSLTYALAIPLDKARQKAKAARTATSIHTSIKRSG